MKFFLILLLAFSAFSCSKQWAYDGRVAPDKWGDLNEEFKFCKIGYNQSPIDVKDDFKDIKLKFSHSESDVDKERNNHVMQIAFFNKDHVARGRKKYFVRQFHFHHPSEHLVKGEQSSLEMQIFHKSYDEQWLVLGLFLKVGQEHAEFNRIIDLFESKQIAGKVDLSKIINKKDKMFFYDGSFTQPPCTEGVKWYLMKTPIEISKEQMNKIIKMGIFVRSNARPEQAFHPARY